MWHEGSVADAVTKAKRNKKALLIFIRSDDLQPDSEAMEGAMGDEGVKEVCEKAGVIALRLSSGSESAKQFGQIYPIVTIPIIFLIDDGGTPLEIIAGKCSRDDLFKRLKKGLAAQEEKITAVQSATLQSPEPQTSKIEEKPIDLEAKVERAKELLQQRQQEKAKQEHEEQKERELKRREETAAALRQQRERDEKEAIAAADERRRQKKEDAEYLRRLKAEIARDRAEKQSKFQQNQATVEEESAAKKAEAEKERQRISLAEQAEKSKYAKIQFRMPDGGSIAETFPADLPFRDVSDFIKPDALERCGEYSLIQMYPRKEFTTDDDDKSLKELLLCPSAVLMVLPKNRKLGGGSGGGGGSFFASIWASLMGLVVWLSALLGFGGGRNPPRIQAAAAGENSQVHGIQERKRGEDEDEARWNGNSTQQL